MESDSNTLVDVEVEFDYEAELADELSIKVGDVIKDVKRMDGGWWEGALNGRRGVFPDNFVKVLHRETAKSRGPISSTPSLTSEDGVQLRRGQLTRASANNKKKCRVLFSYQPKHDDELELKLDDVVEFLSEVEDGWWKGKLRGRVGVFPSNFVEMMKLAANAEDDQTVADKNKRNEKLKVEKTQRPASKISSLIQEAESKAAKKKSSIENLNLVKRESPLGGEDNSSKSDDLSNAPKLPPKPVKEQCIVLFPYNAVNDDELSLEEGQVITIVSKDVEDKGWWKGELEGKVGVFPDNFVRLLDKVITTALPVPVVPEELKEKRQPKVTTAGSAKLPQAAKKKSSLNESGQGSASSSREKLNGGSTDKISSISSSAKKAPPVKKDVKQPASLPPSTGPNSPKKHSFGKSTPPPKPKPPSFSSGNKGSTSSLNNESNVAIKEEETTKEIDLDMVLRSDNKLAHPTAERVKAPKRRPPSSVFQKEAKLSGDAFETLEVSPQAASNEDEENVTPGSSNPSDLKRSASQGSLHSATDNDNLLSTTTRQESKNRLSFKLVRQTMKEALGSLSASNGDKNGFLSKEQTSTRKSTNNSSEETKVKANVPNKPVLPPPPTQTQTGNETKENEPETSKKPEWLAELSRKQANRRSGMFTTSANTSQDEVKPGSSPPKIAEAKPTVAPDKPHIPLKPSQIREEARKSAVFPKRLSNESILGNSNNNNDKENNKPPVGNVHLSKPKPEEKPSSKVIEQPTSKPRVPPVSEPEVAKPPTEASKTPLPVAPASTGASAVGWKPAIIQPPPTVVAEAPKPELSLEERVKQLEDVVASMKTSYDTLQRELEAEKNERRRLQEELRKLNS